VRDRHFEQLRTILYDRGVCARYANRLVAELEDHYADAEAEQLAAGCSRDEARLTLTEQLGPSAAIAAEVLAHPELRGRCCGLRAVLRPMFSMLASTDRTTWDGVATAPAIARWSASITFGSMVTCALLLAMAQTMALGAIP
jgi:hypothetical protein